MKTFEAICSTGSVTIDDDDISCTCCASAAHGSVHLICIQFSALLVQCFTCRNLVPMLDARDAFHITENSNLHTLPPDNGVSQNNPDSGISTEGRYIADVRDKS